MDTAACVTDLILSISLAASPKTSMALRVSLRCASSCSERNAIWSSNCFVALHVCPHAYVLIDVAACIEQRASMPKHAVYISSVNAW